MHGRRHQTVEGLIEMKIVYTVILIFQEWYVNMCFGGYFSNDLEEIIGNLISTWAEAENEECVDIYQKFISLYEVHDRYSGKITLPKPFVKRVNKWLNGDKMLLEKLNKQVP